MVRQSTYEGLTNQLPRKAYSDTPLVDALFSNAGRHMDKRAMLKRNDLEIDSMFKEGTPLGSSVEDTTEQMESDT